MNTQSKHKVSVIGSVIIGVVISVCIIIAMLSCSKDEPEKDVTEKVEMVSIPINTPEDEITFVKAFVEKYGSGRSGNLFNILRRDIMATDNFMLAGSPGYRNEQIAFNKDSILNTRLVRIDPEVVGLFDTTYGIFQATITYKNLNTWTGVVYSENFVGSEKIFIPSGINIAPGAESTITYVRVARTMSYYDNKYLKVKTKYYYNVNIDGLLRYSDAIPGSLNNSSVFRLFNQ